MPKIEVTQEVTETLPKSLAHSLARETQIDPDLARIVEAWPGLPEAIRRAVLALIGSVNG
jgi:hypothetical protein